VGLRVPTFEGAKLSDCLNQNCREKDLHPVTARSYDGCCSPLCEEIMDHERTCDILEETERKLAEITSTLSRAQEQAFRDGFVAGRGSDYDIDRHFHKWLMEAMK